jgi:hypothetical protein
LVDLKHAYYVGQSKIVAGITTDIVAFAGDGIFAEIWVGAEDKLPRVIHAIYLDDPDHLRHNLMLSDWKLTLPFPMISLHHPAPLQHSTCPSPILIQRQARREANNKNASRKDQSDTTAAIASKEIEHTMKKIMIGLSALLFTLFTCSSASAYGHANAWGGGSTTHSGDTTTRTNAYGGSATHTARQGTSASNAYGGSAYHAEGSGKTTASNGYGGTATHTAGQGTSASNGYGGSAYHAEGSGTTTATNAYGGSATHYAGAGTVGTTSSGQTVYASAHYATPTAYYGYHPPTTVAVYGSSCYNCSSGWGAAGAAVAGAVVGATVATAVASSNNAAAANNAYAQGYNAGATNTAVATNAAVANANAAAANANAAAANAYTATHVNYAVGQMTAVLPAGCVTPQVNGKAYYLCGNTWFSAAYGANGVYYTVVPTP